MLLTFFLRGIMVSNFISIFSYTKYVHLKQSCIFGEKKNDFLFWRFLLSHKVYTNPDLLSGAVIWPLKITNQDLGSNFFFRSCFIEINLWNIKNIKKKKLNFFMKKISIFLRWDFFLNFHDFLEIKMELNLYFGFEWNSFQNSFFFFKKMFLTFFLRGVMAPYFISVFITPNTFI